MKTRLLLLCCAVFGVLFGAQSRINAQSPTQAQPVTFNEQIAPIIFSKCSPCHRAGEVAPFPLMNYQDVRRRASMVKAVTQSGYMPPWKPVRGYSSFADERSLSPQETALLAQWVDAGAPEGDPAKTPTPPTFPSGSQLGTPDMVIRMPMPYTVKGVSKDEYRNFVVPTGLFENKIVSAVEFRPGNPKVVHHALLSLDTSGQGRRLDAQDAELGYPGGGGAGFIPAENYPGWVPGATARFFPKGIGISMDKSSDLILQLHYAPSTTQELDQSSVNVYFMKETQNVRLLSRITPMNPTDITGSLLSGFASFIIPANQQARFSARRRIRQDMSFIGIAPHQHLLGRTAKAYAVTPRRDTIPLVDIRDWDFKWQGNYTFKKMIKIPAGSDVIYEASYDNTTNNFRNPFNPPRLSRWGENTSDEMFLCYVLGLPYQTGDENISLETAQSQSTTNVQQQAYPVSNITMTIAPNPASERVSLDFMLPESGTASLEILSVRGERVMTVFSQVPLGFGLHTHAVDVRTLAAGTYFCRLTVQGRSLVQPLLVTR